MTSPYGDNHNSRDEQQGNGGGLPRYDSTPHPEDQPNFGAPNPTSGQYHSQNPGYGGYNNGQNNGYAAGYSGNGGYPDNSAAYGHGPGYQDVGYGAVGGATRQGDGHVDIIDSIKWGFKATFKNAKLWVLGGLAFIAIAFLAGVITAMTGMGGTNNYELVAPSDVLSALVASLITPFIYRLCLHQIDDSSTGWGHIGKDVNFWPTYLVAVLLQLITWVVMWFVVDGVFAVDLSVIDNPASTQEQVIEAALNAGLALGLMGLITFLVTPFLIFIPWFVVERRATFGEAFGLGIKAGARNYFPILGYTILMGLIVVTLAIITLGLAFIVVLPASMLSMAYIYRQASAGQVPVVN